MSPQRLAWCVAGSKLGQIWVKDGSKMGQRWVKDGSKMGQRWVKDGSEMGGSRMVLGGQGWVMGCGGSRGTAIFASVCRLIL